jgi:CcmD family protein
MTDAGYIAAAYVVTFGAIGGYALRTVLRGRKLARRFPREELPWT